MSESSSISEKIPKLPLSNYDVVVYFGVGITFLPFVYRYFLKGSGKALPSVFDGYTDPLINNIVSLVALAFAIYIIGHGISILSSMFIEQFVYRSFFPPSSIIVNASKLDLSGTYTFRRELTSRVFKVYRRPYAADMLRLAFHAPVVPLYIFMYLVGLHGFYETKLNSFIIWRVQKRLESCFDFSESILTNAGWFKIVEYACANDHPVATAKMYNYMVIYGLFRSTSFMVLSSIWLEIFFYFKYGGIGFVDQIGHGSIITRLLVLYSTYFVCFAGFAKFTRRYTEEALQAFALSKAFEG